MVGEVLIDLFFGLFNGLFMGVEFLRLPLDFIDTLSTILAYGTWVVGIDIMAYFVGSIVMWWAVHLSIGVAVWVWKMLPLT